MSCYILADNQDLTRYALESLIGQDGQTTVRRASDKASLVELLKEYRDAVVVLDYTLFDFVDKEQLLIISERFPTVRWVLLSDELVPDFLRSVVYASHQFSVVFKDSPLKELRYALRSASVYERYICPKATELILNQRQEEEKPDILTATEIEILKSIAQGKTSKDIASERISSIHTINTHKKNIFRKLKVNTAHEAIKYALRAGLVDLTEFYI